jgi:hypothetical protein
MKHYQDAAGRYCIYRVALVNNDSGHPPRPAGERKVKLLTQGLSKQTLKPKWLFLLLLAFGMSCVCLGFWGFLISELLRLARRGGSAPFLRALVV